MVVDYSSPWFRRYRRITEPRLRLVCFPHAGGSASTYRNWPRLLPADIEVLAVQYPGRQDRMHEPCLTGMDELAATAVDALAPFLDRPLALFGHSMGASVAHEVALRLPGPVESVFVSARKPPRHHRPCEEHRDDAALLADVLALDADSSAVLDDPDMVAMMLPAIRADFRLADAYRPPARLLIGAPVTAYIGNHDPSVSVWQMRAWSQITESGFDLVVYPGDHFYLRAREAELVNDLAGRLDSHAMIR